MATQITKSIRSSGGDYTTLTLFEDDLPASLITADEQWTAVCYDDWAGGLDDAPQFLTHTCDVTRYIEIKVASGAEHGGIPFGGFYIKEATSATFFFQVYQCDYFKITGIDLNVNIISSNSGFYIYDSDYAELDGNICNYTAVYGNMENYKLNASSNVTLINNLSHTATSGNTYIGFDIDAETNAKVHNNTSISSRYGFYNGNGSGSVASNNVALDSSSKGFLTIGTNYSASEDTSATGTGAITGIDSTEFEDAANDDYHLDSASQLIDAAENLYSTFTTDVDGDTRPSSGDWDIGFDHYAAAGGGVSIDVPKHDLELTSYAPVITASGSISTIIPKHDLSINSHIPVINISNHINVEIPKHNLTITGYVPAINASNHIEVVIPKHDLSINSHIPDVNIGSTSEVIVPKHDINITSYAPVVVNNISASIIVAKSNLALTSHIPTISADGSLNVEIPKSDINLTSHIPTIETSNDISVIIPSHDLSLQSYPPSIVVSSSVNAIIPKTDINLTSYVPLITIAGAFSTAPERIYDYPAVNRVYQYPAINRIYTIKRK